MEVAKVDVGIANGNGISEANGQGGRQESATPAKSSQQIFDSIVTQLSQLTDDHLEELGSTAVARTCLRKQEQSLSAFAKSFAGSADADFKVTQGRILQSFLDMIAGMKIKSTEQSLDSTSSRLGTVTILLPGLPEGVNVTRSTDSFFVNDDATFLQRNEIRVKMGGLDVYSGYWLAVDTPSIGIEDPLQEEGIDTLRRVMEAAGIPLTDEVYEDALEYPFLSALLSPFGSEAILPFEEHLRSLHSDYAHRHGGRWFKMQSARKERSKLEQVVETDDEVVLGEDENGRLPSGRPRGALTEAEEADLELSKLDL